MSFGTYALLAFGAICIFFLWKTWRDAKEAGRDDVLAQQSKDAGKARRNAQEAESRVDGMSDDDVRKRLHDTSER